MKPLISIIIPVYNVEKYLTNCLKSVTNQTLQNIQIICVEDCSVDGSKEILKTTSKTDERILIIEHKNNSGLSTARNTGLLHAIAPYIMFLDSDDSFEPTICEKMLNQMEKDFSMAICKRKVIFEEGARDYKDLDSLDENYKAVWNKVFRKDIIDKYGIIFPDGLIGEDQCFCNCYYEACKRENPEWKIGRIHEDLHNYLIRSGSIMDDFLSKKSFEKMLDAIKMPKMFYSFYEKYNMLEYRTYNTYFNSLNFGLNILVKTFFEDKIKLNIITEIIAKNLKCKPQIKVKDDGLYIGDDKYIINKVIFEKIKIKQNSLTKQLL